MENIVIVVIVLLIVGAAIYYIVREKKKGVKCVGCPYAKSCSATQKQTCNSQSNGQ